MSALYIELLGRLRKEEELFLEKKTTANDFRRRLDVITGEVREGFNRGQIPGQEGGSVLGRIYEMREKHNLM